MFLFLSLAHGTPVTDWIEVVDGRQLSDRSFEWSFAQGDFDGDSHHDVAFVVRGALLVVPGSPSGLTTNPSFLLDDVDLFAPLGVGDLNGDGIDDLLVMDDDSRSTFAYDVQRVFYGSLDGDVFHDPLGSAYVGSIDLPASFLPNATGPFDMDGDGAGDAIALDLGDSSAIFVTTDGMLTGAWGGDPTVHTPSASSQWPRAMWMRMATTTCGSATKLALHSSCTGSLPAWIAPRPRFPCRRTGTARTGSPRGT